MKRPDGHLAGKEALRSAVLAVLVLAFTANASMVHADPTSRARPTRPPATQLVLVQNLAPLAGSLDSEVPPHSESFEPRTTHRRLRRSRFMLGLGSGLTVAGIVGTSIFGRRGICTGSQPRHGWLPGALAAGLTTITVGVGFTVGGTVTLLGVPREARAQDRARFHDRAGPVWIGVMTAIVGTSLFTVGGLLPFIDCNNS